MECCANKNINNENICINCGVIHGYKYVHEDVFIHFNMNISNILYYKQSIYRRKKYLYKECLQIKKIKNNILLFFDKSLEDIRKLYKLKRIPMSKYLNSIYNFYCNKSLIIYQSIFENKKIIDLNDNIIEILEKNYLNYPYVKKDEEDDYIYL